MILVIEDEPGIVDFIERGLKRQGFEVAAATDGRSGLQRALEPEIELVLLDLMLPELDGMSVLAELHAERPQLPVIILTSRSELEDRIAGLDSGAVDYLVKPFSVAELAARIRAQLRHVAHAREATSIELGELRLDLVTRSVKLAESPVRLTTTEFELLVYLAQHRDTVVTREQILRSVWGYEHDPGTNVVEVYIGYLRRKLRRPDRPSPILTVRSVGYRIDVESFGATAA